MKNFKTLLTLTAVFAFASSAAFAQVDIDSDITVSAVAVQALTVTNNANINLGTVQAGTASTLDPNAGATNSNVGETATLGQVTIDGQDGLDVIVTFNNAILHDQLGSDPDETFTTTAYSVDLSGGEGVLTSGGVVELGAISAAGTAVITFGGTTDGLPATTWGTTDGTPITVTANYN